MSVHLHREEIKARLRIRFGSVAAFEVARSLPRRSVSDVLRGRGVRQTEMAIAAELGIALHEVSPRYADFASTIADDSTTAAGAHRQSGKVN